MSVLSLRRRAALPVAVVATSLSAALAASLVTAAPADAQTAPAPAERAAAWLAGQLDPAGLVIATFGDDSFVDYGRSLDSALALLATGSQPNVLGRTTFSVEQPAAVASYTQGAPFDVPSEGQEAPPTDDPAYVGATAKLAFVVELAGGDATATGGVDLLAQLQSLATPEGRFADRSNFGDFANLFGHAFALLAQDAAGQTVPPEQIAALLAEQCDDGGFPEGYTEEGQTCESSVDASGLVLQALAAVDVGATPAGAEAVAYLEDQQQADGSFPGEVPVNSTGYAAAGLLAVDDASDAAADASAYLADVQNTDGGLPGAPGGASDLFATAQALPALVGADFADGARPVVRRPAAASIDPLCEDAPASRFSDVPQDDVHAGSIRCMTGFDVVRGFDATTFGPGVVVTRAQTASLLARALEAAGVELPANGPSFTDVPAGSTHSAAISALAELEVVRGRTATTFAPDQPVRRDQMASLLSRGYEVATGTALPESATPFTDVTGVHATAIGRITGAGITAGTTATTYSPERSVTRGSMASFVARTLNLVLVAGQPVQEPEESTAR